jgi:hypothetical protein
MKKQRGLQKKDTYQRALGVMHFYSINLCTFIQLIFYVLFYVIFFQRTLHFLGKYYYYYY